MGIFSKLLGKDINKGVEEFNASAEGWLLDVLKCGEKIPTSPLSSSHVYAFEPELKKKHPGNHHIKDKIRQQLQVLRDKGFIDFVGRGRYNKYF